MENKAKETESILSAKTAEFVERLTQFGKLLTDAKSKSISTSLTESFEKSLDKIDTLKKDVLDGTLKIALIGAFSDGKTSTVAGFLGNADSNMKIADEESTDEIVEYIPQNIDADVPSCMFVDTPGLFGHKFSQKTEEWISQAHLILYIVSAVNPLKDSHRDTVSWLLKKLRKFDNTVFVINMMDKVCDYTDSEDFEDQKEAKKRFLRENVARFCNLDPNDKSLNNLNIVCIASDPDARGLQYDGKGHENYWLTTEHRKEYENYSRMEVLRTTVNNVVRNTFADSLIRNSALVAIMDETKKNGELLLEETAHLEDVVIPEVVRTVEVLTDDFNNARNDMRREVRPCRDQLMSLENAICGKIQNATMDDFDLIIQNEIGGGDELGYKLNGKIKDIIADHFEGLVTRMCAKITGDFKMLEDCIDSTLKIVNAGAKTIGNLAKGVDKAMIFAGRDLLGKVGLAIKFKPWQATKIANFASKGIPAISAAISLALDTFSIIHGAEEQKKFEGMKRSLIESIRFDIFKDLYDILNDDKRLFETFAPQIIEIESQINKAQEQLNGYRNIKKYCNDLRNQLLTYWEE